MRYLMLLLCWAAGLPALAQAPEIQQRTAADLSSQLLEQTLPGQPGREIRSNTAASLDVAAEPAPNLPAATPEETQRTAPALSPAKAEDDEE